MIIAGLILIPPIGKYIENKINTKIQVKNFGTVKVITCIILLFICGFVSGNSSSYKSAQTYIQNKEWKQAHETLITIKDYKNSKELLKEIDYNYYKEVGDKFYKSKNYDEALKNYRNAKTGFNDADIDQKITKTSSELEAKKTIKTSEKMEINNKNMQLFVACYLRLTQEEKDKKMFSQYKIQNYFAKIIDEICI